MITRLSMFVCFLLVILSACQTQNTPKELPVIQGNLTQDWISFERFSPDASVTIEIFESEGGPMIGDPHRIQTDGGGNGWFNVWEFEINLQPGMLVLVSDDASDIVKELMIENLCIDVFDISLDKVAGGSPPEVLLQVNAHDEVLNEGYSLEVTTGSDGKWLADFGMGIDIDLNENMNPQVLLFDEDGDATVAELADSPYIEGNLPLDWIAANNFTPDSSVTLWIYESESGPNVKGSPFTVPTNWRGQITFEGSENGVDLQPGMYLVIRDNDDVAIEKELSLVDVVIEPPDFENNELRGTGPKNTLLTIEVYDHTNGEQYFVDVMTDDSGNWYSDFFVEFGVPLPNEDYCDHIKLYDEDGDASVADPIGPS